MANTPGFLTNGIDFKPFVQYYCVSGYRVIISDPAEVTVAFAVAKNVIDNSFGYSDEAVQEAHTRIQMIFNSTLQEMWLEYAGLGKRSSSIWLVNGTAERGTDFQANGKQIEAKVYKTADRMFQYAKDASKDSTVFHNADYVCVYLINSYERTIIDKRTNMPYTERTHWVWLKRDDAGNYVEHYDDQLEAITKTSLPAELPVCYCKFTADNKLIIGRNTFCN